MKRYTILFAVMLSAAVSCSKNEIQSGNPADGSAIDVVMQDATKVAVGDKTGEYYPLSWEAGDRILVNYSTVSDPLDASYAGSRQARFTTETKINYPITLVYPSSVQGGSNYILIPSEQTYANARLDGGCGVLVGYVPRSGIEATMKHATGYIRIPVTGTARIKTAALSAIGGEFLAGRFAVDAASASLKAVPSPSSSIESSSRVTMSIDRTLAPEPLVLLFSVPAGTYLKGFKVTFKDEDGNAMSKTMYTSSGKSVSAGVVTEMPVVSYVPGAPETEIFEVSQTDVQFQSREYSAADVRVTTTDEDVMVSFSGLEWLGCDFPSVIPAGKTISVSAMPLGANVSENRKGVLTLTGSVSGVVKKVNFSQTNLYSAVDGFPALWEISASKTCVTDGVPNEYGKQWISEGIAPVVNGGAKQGTGYVSAGSTSGRKLVYSIDVSSSTKTIAVGGMGEGDYILFSVPVLSVPAGTDFDFMITLNANTTAAPKYWIFEYWDGDQWKCDPSRLYTAAEDSSVKYSFYIKHFSSANHRTFIQSFTLENAVDHDFVKMRIRAVGNVNGADKTLTPTANALVYLATTTYQACNIVCYKDAPAIKDHTRMMQLGNSFTYYFGSAFKLKEMCRRGGHQTEVHINVKGSQEFEHHMYNLAFSQEVVTEGGYAKAILQDGSYFHAEYGKGSKDCIVGVTPKYSPAEILKLTQDMGAMVRKYSPSAEILLESVWSYSRKAAGDNYLGFGSFAEFDKYQWKGSTEIAAQSKDINWLSPIGKAFANARSNYGFTSAYNYLTYTDNYHDSREGAYLKACVNYLILFGDDFTEFAPDCDLAPADAAKLRQAARDIVMADRESFHIR